MWFDIKILLVANDYPGGRIKIEEISLFLDCSQVGRADFAALILSWAEDYKSFIFLDNCFHAYKSVYICILRHTFYARR